MPRPARSTEREPRSHNGAGTLQPSDDQPRSAPCAQSTFAVFAVSAFPCRASAEAILLWRYRRSRLGELRRVDRDIRLHLAELDDIPAGHPRKRPLERHFHAGDVPIIIE